MIPLGSPVFVINYALSGKIVPGKVLQRRMSIKYGTMYLIKIPGRNTERWHAEDAIAVDLADLKAKLAVQIEESRKAAMTRLDRAIVLEEILSRSESPEQAALDWWEFNKDKFVREHEFYSDYLQKQLEEAK